MTPFDLQQLLDFSAPAYLCRKCGAIYLERDLSSLAQSVATYLNLLEKRTAADVSTDYSYLFVAYSEKEKREVVNALHKAYSKFKKHATCSSCGQQFAVMDPDPYSVVYVDETPGMGIFIGLDQELVVQGIEERHLEPVGESEVDYYHTLARIAKEFGEGKMVPALLRALGSAQRFVHFATFSFDAFFQGIVMLLAQRVKVKGVIGVSSKDWSQGFISEGPSEGSEIYFDRSGEYDKAHQKLLIVDGLLAIHGSMNLTLNALRKLGEPVKRECAEMTTSVEKVQNLNNRFFSPVFAAAKEAYLEECRFSRKKGRV